MKYGNYLLILIMLTAVFISAGCVDKTGTDIPNITGPWTEATSTVHQNGDEGFSYPALTDGIFDVTLQEGRLFSGRFSGTDFYGSFFDENATHFMLAYEASGTKENVSEILIGTVLRENEIQISGAKFLNTDDIPESEDRALGVQSFTLARNGVFLQTLTYPDVSGAWMFQSGSVMSQGDTTTISGENLVVRGQEGALFYGIIDDGGRSGYTNFSAVMYDDNKIQKFLLVTDDGQIWFGAINSGEITIISTDDKTSESTVTIITKTYEINQDRSEAQKSSDLTGIWITKRQEVISKSGYDAGLPSDFIISVDKQTENCLIGTTSYMGVNEGEIGGMVSPFGEVILFRYNKNGGVYLGMGQVDQDALTISEIFTEAGTRYISEIVAVRS